MILSHLLRNWHSNFPIIVTRKKFLSKVKRLKRAKFLIIFELVKVEGHSLAFTGQVHCLGQLLFDHAFCQACFGWRWTHAGERKTIPVAQ